jgi:membrane-associated protease RseP (regulator of RpoE activity)
MSGVVRTKPSNIWVNILLMGLTVVSVFYVGLYYSLGSVYSGPVEPSSINLVQFFLPAVPLAIAYTISLLSILLAHEFGHYLAGRYHRTAVTLPYFIPFPNIIGTLGAFIQLKEPPKNRRILLDIGIAGPLAGLVVAIPVLLVGLSLSEMTTIPQSVPQGGGLSIEGNSVLYLGMKYLAFGKLLPSPASYESIAPVIYWLRFFFTGRPIPWGGSDVLLHPVAWAGWVGLLVTALNLVPAGQLDGGHVLYVLLGKRATRWLPLILAFMVALGFAWTGWWLWAGLIFLFGRYHAEPLDQITPLDPTRRGVALLGIIIFFLVFTPVPFLGQGF